MWGICMILLLSPSKTFVKNEEFHEECPYFLNQSIGLIRKLKLFSSEELQNKMKISSDLAQDVKTYYQNFGMKKYCAIYSYNGYLYKALDVNTLTKEDLDYMRHHLYIISGLYGLVRPFDGISFYRLEMQDKIVGNLYHYWGKKINNYLKLQHQDEILINLASKEYIKVLNKAQSMITISFYIKSEDELKSSSMHVKKARGMMARELIKRKIDNPELIKSITFDGYQFHPFLSDEKEYVFIKEA